MNFDKHESQRKLDDDSNLMNPIRLDNFKLTDEEGIEKRLKKIAKGL